MILVDVNVLLAAHRLDHGFHDRAKAWLDAALAAEVPSVTVPDLVWVGFLRIATSHRVFNQPSTIAEAVAFAQALIEAPAYFAAPSARGGLTLFLRLAQAAGVAGNLVTDAYIAACALSLDAAVATFDTDFHRFEGLRLIKPGP
jgi:toxin-antitoxin system PIN domain toxin